MQISQNNNNTSFGIHMVRFEDKASKSIFNAKNRFIQPESLDYMWEQISKIKPKHGSDVDVFISKSTDGLYNVLYTKAVENGSTVKTYQKIHAGEDENTVSGIVQAFKDLVKQIDHHRAKKV